MSEIARNEYNSARDQQLTRNDARRIRTRVDDARDSASASRRWPFELIQNAHDAGPRDGDERVEIAFQFRGSDLAVSHTGKPFSPQELAALLSGGSSKEFDDQETTGRFGTGFLATHALSTRVDVGGIIDTQEGFERFVIELDRGGDEDSIAKNIAQADASVMAATRICAASVGDQPTASFTYYDADDSVVNNGLERLREALPYLYGTCPKLGQVTMVASGTIMRFDRGATSVAQQDGVTIETTSVNIVDSGVPTTVAVARTFKDGDSSLLAVFETADGTTSRFVAPPERFPRLFVQFPLGETSSLPLNVVINGRFKPQQERDGIAMNADDKELIANALATLPVLVAHAIESGQENAHQLASIAAPSQPLGGENATDEIPWWQETVLEIADSIAKQPVIHTAAGLLPAVSHSGDAASFLVPAINKASPESVDYHRMHEIASLITELHIPDLGIAQDWLAIATQWDALGVPVERLGFHELTDWIKKPAKTVADIPVSADPYRWLAQLFLLGAQLNDHNVATMVNGLLPDQRGEFRNTKTEFLYGDAGVSDEIKSISDLVEIDQHSQLLHIRMANALNALGFEPAKDLVWSLLDKKDDDKDYAESDALEEILDSLTTALPDDSEFDPSTSFPPLRASARLAQYLWESSGDQQHLRQCPLLTAENEVVRLTGNQQILAPVSHWPESARPYAHLYTERRILSGCYCDDDTVSGALAPFIAAGLVIATPLYRAPRSEIDDINLLSAMASEKFTETQVTVRNETFGQIAFLASDLVQRCGQDGELAKALLDFVLNVAAKEDSSWREVNQITGTSSGQRIPLSLYGATWPFELKVRSWVPVQIPDEERFQPMPANESNLRDMLDHTWLRNNPDAVDLLHQIFGFSQLALLTEGLDAEVENGLVALLKDPELRSVVSNPEVVKVASNLAASTVPLESIQEIIQDVENDQDLITHLAERREQKRRVNENQKLGYHVEDLVRENLEGAGFAVNRTGVGSDFEISAELGDVANLELTLGDRTWLVEVKSTRDQRVRMTDTQAKTAVQEGDAFLLCVVPVSAADGMPDLDEVKAAMRFVQNCGHRLEHLCNNLGEFEDQRDAITAEESEGVQLEITSGQARVRVFSSVWEEDGLPLDELADRLASTIAAP